MSNQKTKRALPNARQKAFLAAYATSGNISAAAKLSKVHRSQHYDWIDADPAYAAAFAAAHDEAADLLETEARRRATVGVAEPVVYKGSLTHEPLFDKDGNLKRNEKGEVQFSKTPLTIRRYSDVLLIFLLKGARPQVYRDNFKGEATTPRRTVAELRNLSDEQLEELETLARSAGVVKSGK